MPRPSFNLDGVERILDPELPADVCEGDPRDLTELSREARPLARLQTRGFQADMGDSHVVPHLGGTDQRRAHSAHRDLFAIVLARIKLVSVDHGCHRLGIKGDGRQGPVALKVFP